MVDKQDADARDHEAPDAAAPGDDEPRRNRVVTPLVAVLIVALVAATGVLGYLYYQEREHEQLRQSAAATAGRLAVQLATYDFESVDENLEAVTAEATQGFADEYREVAAGLEELLVNGEGSSTATVPHSAVESVDGERAVVLVFLDQEVSNVTVPEGRVDASRMVVALERSGDQWLLDSADLA